MPTSSVPARGGSTPARPWPNRRRLVGLVRLVDRLSRRRRSAAAASSSARPSPDRRSSPTPRRTRCGRSRPTRRSAAREHLLERLVDLLRDDQQGRQRLPARQLHRGLVEGGRLLLVRRRLPLHRRLQRQVHEVHERAAPTTSATASAGTARAAPGSTATCDQRKLCCNAFRYGQCNTQVKCSGGVHCRVVSCVRRTRGPAAPRPRSAATPPPSTARRTCRSGGRWSSSTPDGRPPLLPQGLDRADPYGGRRPGRYVDLPGRPDLVDEHHAAVADDDLRPHGRTPPSAVRGDARFPKAARCDRGLRRRRLAAALRERARSSTPRSTTTTCALGYTAGPCGRRRDARTALLGCPVSPRRDPPADGRGSSASRRVHRRQRPP